VSRKDDPALDLIAGLVLSDGRRWGDVAAKFQWQDVRAILDPDGGTPSYHYLTRSRGASKTSDLAAIAIGMMLAQLPPGSRLYALASDRDQARLLLDAIGGFAARTPTVGNALVVGANRVSATRSGTTLDVLAADAPGAWGLRPDLVIVDELAIWPETWPRWLLRPREADRTHPPNRLSTASVGGELAHACREGLSGRGGGRRADTECGAEHDLGVADIVQLDLASHVLGDPRGYDLAAGLGVGTRVPDTE